jgi:hypothetical protein
MNVQNDHKNRCYLYRSLPGAGNQVISEHDKAIAKNVRYYQ